jgi:WD40 repeat protein
MKLHATFSATLLIGCFNLMGSQSLVAQEPKLRTTLYGHKMGVIAGFFSPDGKLLVTKAGDTLLWDVATEKSTKIGDGLADPLFFSPDGNLLLLCRNKSRDFQIYDIARRNNSVLTITPGETNEAMSPDGRRQLVIKNNTLFLRDLATPYDVTTGGNTVEIPGAIVPGMANMFNSVRGAPVHPMQFSADGKTLVFKDKDSNFMLWDVGSGKSTKLPKSAGLYFALSPDSKTMVARCGTKAPGYSIKGLDDNIQIFKLATGKSIASLQSDKNQNGTVTTMVYSPDSKTIATASVYQVVLWNATNGRNTAILRKPRNELSDSLREVHFAPDSKTLVATSGNAFEFWDIAGRKITGSLPIDGPTLLAFSPDGALLATGGKDGRIRLWDMPGGKQADKK